jgi:hypothetical protein
MLAVKDTRMVSEWLLLSSENESVKTETCGITSDLAGVAVKVKIIRNIINVHIYLK